MVIEADISIIRFIDFLILTAHLALYRHSLFRSRILTRIRLLGIFINFVLGLLFTAAIYICRVRLRVFALFDCIGHFNTGSGNGSAFNSSGIGSSHGLGSDLHCIRRVVI